jgi:hypothetical protein
MLQPTQDNKPAKSAHVGKDSYVSKKENFYDNTSARKKRREVNRKSHKANKITYDRRAKIRQFKKGEFVYLYNPAMKPRHSKKFHFLWSGPFQITAKLSDLNYELLGHKARKFIVHVNRLKPCLGPAKQEAKPTPRCRTKIKPKATIGLGTLEKLKTPSDHYVLSAGYR